jgi:hypothetical protein
VNRAKQRQGDAISQSGCGVSPQARPFGPGTSDWIATAVCHEVPHRQFVFTIPKVLRGIFRKRRQLLTHLFHTATATLRDSFRTRLALPDGKLGAIAAVHTFGQKITWNETTKTVIYRSKRHHTTKRNFEIFKAPDFIAAALLHLPPKGQQCSAAIAAQLEAQPYRMDGPQGSQTVRYYGVYSNKARGLAPPIPDHIIRPPTPSPNQQSKINNHQSEILLIPAPPKQSPRDMRPLWRDLILQVWGGDPLQCPCCKGTLKPVRQVIHREQIEYSLLTSVSISSNPKADWYGVRGSVLNSSSVSMAFGRVSSSSHARHRRPSTSTPWSPSSRRGWRSRSGSPTTNRTSTGSIVPEIQTPAIPTGLTNLCSEALAKE